MDRRSALKALAVAAGTAALEACSGKHISSAIPVAPSPALLKLPRVNVQPDREIRTITGLRPFRPSGFLIAGQKFDETLVVHNYGHGGAGVTLSWGTSELACRLVDATDTREIAVLGCGAVGLSTARLLQDRGRAVTIYASQLPPNTTSNVAGAMWSPVLVSHHDHEPPGFMDQLVEASRIANHRYQLMVGPRYGIRWLPAYQMSNDPFGNGGLRSPGSPIYDLFPESHELDARENPFPYKFVRQFDTMLIEPNSYLPALMRDFQIAGGHIEIREIHNVAELQSLPQRVIVNCTGLGSRTLFGDTELIPVKGQLTFLLPQPEVQYCTIPDNDLYMFPRTDGILLGGTHEEGVWSLEPDLQMKQHILAEHARIFREMR